jgi:hypothetical protein
LKKSKLIPSLEEAFSLGKKEGAREILEELSEIITGDYTLTAVRMYIKARLKTLSVISNNPFKSKESK